MSGKKSKLELKMEKAKKDKEAAALLELEKKQAEEQKEKEAKDAQIALEQELLKIKQQENELKLQQVMDNASAVLDGLKLEDENESDEEDSDEDNDIVTSTITDQEKEARMMSTLFGDEVHSEYGRTTNASDTADQVDGSGKTKRKEKLSRKAQRNATKEAEAAAREIEYNIAAMKASAEGAQFAVSQSIIDPNDPQWQNALDVIIPSVSISAHNKELLVNAEVTIVHGRRYGLVAPNGAGKSTLLKMIAAKELKIPPRVDYLYVEQEVMADDTPAVDAVLKADKYDLL
eukprot:gene15990-21699_t